MRPDHLPTSLFRRLARLFAVSSAILLIFATLFISIQPSSARGLMFLTATVTASNTPTPVPSADLLPAIHTADTVEALRTLHDVQPMQALDDQRNIYALPDGVYGFTVPWLLNSDPTSVWGGTGLGHVALFHDAGGTAVMEMHKVSPTEIYVIGYVSPDDVERLFADAEATLELVLFMEPYETFTVPVAIPAHRLLYSNHRSVAMTYVLDVVVALTDDLTELPQPEAAEPIVLPAPGQNPILMGDSVDDLRSFNGVEALDWLDEGKELSVLPERVYGYTVPWMLNSDGSNVVGGTGIDKISLIREPGGTRQMEVHFIGSSKVYIIGHLSEDEWQALTDAAPDEVIPVTLFMPPYEDHTLPVAIPVERILFANERSIDTGERYIYVIDLELSVITEGEWLRILEVDPAG